MNEILIPMPRETRFSTVAEVAKAFRVSNMTIYRMIDSGELPAYRIGRLMRIPTAAAWAYLRGQLINPDNLSRCKAL